MSEYQPRTAERLIGILRAQDENPRSWQQEAAEEIERLRQALILARTRIEYLGAVASNKKHFLANQDEFLPRIDAALSITSGIRKSES